VTAAKKTEPVRVRAIHHRTALTHQRNRIIEEMNEITKRLEEARFALGTLYEQLNHLADQDVPEEAALEYARASYALHQIDAATANVRSEAEKGHETAAHAFALWGLPGEAPSPLDATE
jgi:hypothetical protein